MGCCESRRLYPISTTNSISNEPLKDRDVQYFLPPVYNKKKYVKPKILNLSGLKHISDFRKLAVAEKLMNSYDSEVCLMARNVVRKCYSNPKKGKKESLQEYINEVETLKYLQNCSFTPRLLAYDTENLAIYMNYIEGKPKKNFETIRQLNEKLKILTDEYGIRRIKHYHWSNVIGTEDNIILVDFGSVPIKYQVDKKTKWLIDFTKLYKKEDEKKSE